MPTFIAIDPTTGERVRSQPDHTAAQVEQALSAASHAAVSWAATPLDVRCARLVALAEALEQQVGPLAARMAEEVGKPLAQGRSEVLKSAGVCRFYAESAAGMLAPELIDTDAARSFVRLDPLGPVLGIMPWNFPVWQVLRFAAPALVAGNPVLLKHAPGTPGVAAMLVDLFAAAGFPEGAFQALYVDVDVTASVIADPRVAAVTLTGSSRAGEAVAALAGRALKKCVLELGGSDPFVVLADADIEAAADAAVASRTLNAGQSCIAAKRWIVVESVAEAFTAAVLLRLRALVVGDPRDPETDVGPLARRDLRDALHAQVAASVAAGAVLLLGGELPSGPGAFYPVTLLSKVGPGQPAWDDETFGPVAAIRVVADTDEAIAAANDTRYGLGAALFTADRAAGERLAGRLAAGCVFINSMVKSDARLPFGGVKRSGFGRELAWHGLRAFVNEKTVWVD